MPRCVLVLMALGVVGCGDGPVATDTPGTSLPLAPSSSILSSNSSTIFQACFDPTEGVCFELRNVEATVERDEPTFWGVRVNLKFRMKGRALPVDGLALQVWVGSVWASESDGTRRLITLASEVVEGDLRPAQVVVMSGLGILQKSDWSAPPLDPEAFELNQLALTLQTPDGLWWAFNCRIGQRCYRGT